jgi:hypothetical protein
MSPRCFVGILATGLALGNFACDESLPPRNNPDVVLIPSMRVTAGVVSVDILGNTSGGNVVLRAVNVYNEALSEKQNIRGIVALRLKGLTQTMLYTSSDLQNTKVLSGNTLTVLPKDSVVLFRLWDHITDMDVPFWSVLSFTEKTTTNGRVYYESDTAWIQITATLQLFERVPAMPVPAMVIPIVYRMDNKPHGIPTRISGLSDTDGPIHQN